VQADGDLPFTLYVAAFHLPPPAPALAHRLPAVAAALFVLLKLVRIPYALRAFVLLLLPVSCVSVLGTFGVLLLRDRLRIQTPPSSLPFAVFILVCTSPHACCLPAFLLYFVLFCRCLHTTAYLLPRCYLTGSCCRAFHCPTFAVLRVTLATCDAGAAASFAHAAGVSFAAAVLFSFDDGVRVPTWTTDGGRTTAFAQRRAALGGLKMRQTGSSRWFVYQV